MLASFTALHIAIAIRSTVVVIQKVALRLHISVGVVMESQVNINTVR